MTTPPRIRIPAHVLGYSIALVPAFVFAYYYRRNAPSDEELEHILREKYSRNISNSAAGREEIVDFVVNAKNGSALGAFREKQIDELLRAGKGDKKRHYRVDERYYGTAEGLEAKERVVKTLQKKEKKKKKAKKKRRKKAVEVENGDAPHQSQRIGQDESTGTILAEVSPIATIAAVGVVAAIAGVLLGAGRSR